MACALPRLNISHPDQIASLAKHVAYATTWEPDGVPGTVAISDLAEAVDRALAADREALRATASELARRYRAGFAALVARLD
jgi:hypothetical protein